MMSGQTTSVILIIGYVALIAVLGYYFWLGLTTITFSEILQSSRESKWIIATYTDFTATLVSFVLPYFWNHHCTRGGSFGLRLLWTIVIVGATNCVTLVYLIWTLVEGGLDDPKERLLGYRGNNGRTRGGIRWALVWFAGIIIVYAGVTIWAAVGEPFGEGTAKLKKDPWALATFVDLLVGFAIFSTIVALRETSWAVWAAWTVAVVIIGGGVAALYSLLIMLEAAKTGESFGKVLLTPKTNGYV